MSRRFWIILVGAVILLILVSVIIKKQVQKKKELAKFGGVTREEFKRKLQLAWKDYFFKTHQQGLKTPESWAVEWRRQIDQEVFDTGKDLDDLILKATQFAWAKDRPKANDNDWSAGWLREIYVRQTLGLDPSDPEIREVIAEI